MVINGIDTKNISVVVQGAVDVFLTPLCLASIREHLPEAEIILSTWEGTDVDGLDYDHVVQSKDPGGFDHNNVEYSVKNNFNRQITSTIQGLRISSRQYAVKMRTDFVLESAGFLEWFNRYPARNEQYSFFRHKVIACEKYSRNPRFSNMEHRYALHPADIFFFGLTEDLIDLFDCPFFAEEDQIYLAHKHRDQYSIGLARFVPEQALWLSFLKKQEICKGKLPEDREDFSAEALELTEKTFAANLLILSNKQIGIQCAKLGVYLANPKNCYSHFDWLCLYSHYCEKKWALYGAFRLKTFCVNEWAKLRTIPRKIGRAGIQKLKGWIRGKIQPRLSQEQKEALAPIYVKLLAAYRWLSWKAVASRQEITYAESYFNEPVTPQDLSVVIQGAISAATRNCAKSVRKVLPGAEIVLSTWDGADVTEIDYDKVVFSHDPGQSGLIRLYPHKQINNVNRQIVSSLAGIKCSSRKYCMKIRSDMLLKSNNFLKYYNCYSQYLAADAPVERRIMVEGLMTNFDIIFDVSDWWYLGLKHDLQKLFGCQLYPYEKEPYFLNVKHKKEKPPLADLICRFIPEQYIAYSFFKRCVNAPYAKMVEFRHAYDHTTENVYAYRRFLASCFFCLECAESGVVLPKAENVISPQTYTNACFSNWLDLCREFRTLPADLFDPKLKREKIQQRTRYAMAPRYYDVENYSNIIQNYARLNGQEDLPSCSIQKSDITFVVSGKIQTNGEQNTHRTLESVRRFFPQSKIILSTWKGEPIEKLSGLYDEIVLLDAPKAKQVTYFLPGHPDKRLNSVNLQQMSVHAGMSRVKTTYACRLRTDFYLFNDNLLAFYTEWSEKLHKTDKQYRLFESRVLVTQLFTYDARLGGYPYAMADSFQFGRTEDLLKLWDGHQESLRTFNYFAEHPDTQWDNPKQFNHRYRDEQYFLLHLIREKLPKIVLPKYYFDHSAEDFVFETEKIHAANLLIGDFMQLGLVSTLVDEANHPICLTHNRLLELYLYNIEPGNEACLRYLKEQYTVPPAPRQPIVRTMATVAGEMTRGVVRAVRKGVKCMMRVIFPAYRAAAGTRDRLIGLESAEYDRFNYLAYQVGQLSKQLRKQEEEFKGLRALLRSEEAQKHQTDGENEE